MWIVDNTICMFSSPLGDFVFYIPEELTVSGWLDLVFVPIRGFYFLYNRGYYLSVTPVEFSSPLGDFVFYIKYLRGVYYDDKVFVPIRGFCFLYRRIDMITEYLPNSFRPR